MLYLFLSISSSILILILLKLIAKYDIKVIQPIIINYFVAATLGFFFSGLTPKEVTQLPADWVLPGVFIGSLYILTFFLIGYSTKKVGMALTTIASRMSFVFPMFFSILIDPNDNFSFTKILLLLMAVTSVFLSVYKKKTKTIDSLFIILLPFILFVLMGIADSIVKYAQNSFVKNENQTLIFSFIIFSFAAIWGLILIMFQKDRKEILQPKVLISGIILGIFNFGSLYFFINTLNSLSFNNSLVIALNNLGVVLFSIIIALTLFKEKVTKLNKAGIAFTIITCIAIIMFI